MVSHQCILLMIGIMFVLIMSKHHQHCIHVRNEYYLSLCLLTIRYKQNLMLQMCIVRSAALFTPGSAQRLLSRLNAYTGFILKFKPSYKINLMESRVCALLTSLEH